VKLLRGARTPNITETSQLLYVAAEGLYPANHWEMRRKDAARGFPFRLELTVLATISKHPKEGLRLLLSMDLQLDNSSLQPDRDSMSPVLGIELREYVCDVAFYTCFAD